MEREIRILDPDPDFQGSEGVRRSNRMIWRDFNPDTVVAPGGIEKEFSTVSRDRESVRKIPTRVEFSDKNKQEILIPFFRES